MAHSVGARLDEPDGRGHDRGCDQRAGRRPPYQGKTHQPVDVIRAFEHETKVTLEFTVIGAEDDVDIVVPARVF